jgi:hypothetical protein
MEQTTPKVEVKNPLKDALDMRMKRVEILGKIDEIRTAKILDEIQIEREKVELEQTKRKENGYNSPLDKLLEVARACCIDNERTVVGSEPAIVSLWDASELEMIKRAILKKVKEL